MALNLWGRPGNSGDPFRNWNEDMCCNGDCDQGRRCPLVPNRLPAVTPEPPCEQRPARPSTRDVLRVVFIVLACIACTASMIHFAARVAS